MPTPAQAMTEEYDFAQFVPSRVEHYDGKFHIYDRHIPYYADNPDFGTEAKKAMLLKREVAVAFRFDGMFRHVQALRDARADL